MQVYFQINESLINQLTWEEYEAFELAQEGQVKMYKLRPLIARFVTDENKRPLSHAAAMKQLAAIPMNEVKDVFQQFSESLTRTAIPPTNGEPLRQPSEAALPSVFPAGSEQ